MNSYISSVGVYCCDRGRRKLLEAIIASLMMVINTGSCCIDFKIVNLHSGRSTVVVTIGIIVVSLTSPYILNI